MKLSREADDLITTARYYHMGLQADVTELSEAHPLEGMKKSYRELTILRVP